jgi:hypothetical protein
MVTSVALVVMLGGGVSLLGAPGASAAADVGDYIGDCYHAGIADFTFEGNIGDSFTLGAVGDHGVYCGGWDSNPGIVSYPSSTYDPGVNPWTASGSPVFYAFEQLPITVTLTTPGTTTLTWQQSGAGLSITVTVLAARVAASAVVDQTPPAWMQSYGRADKDDKCTGGWNPSYASWPNDGKGGWVCDRTLAYNTSTRNWDVS